MAREGKQGNMTTTRKLIIAFWIFIIGMLVWEFYDYNQGLSQQAKDHPRQTQFFAYPPGSGPAAKPVPVRAAGADVQQTAFTIEEDTPGKGSFTCHITLKNEGQSIAVAVQVKVRPFRGVSNYDEDAGSQRAIVLSDDDPISRIGEFVSFPDLAPNESSTQSVVFLSRSDFKPGKNPSPQILFQTEKPKPRPPPPPGAGG
jgi:hypothetical protein